MDQRHLVVWARRPSRLPVHLSTVRRSVYQHIRTKREGPSLTPSRGRVVGGTLDTRRCLGPLATPTSGPERPRPTPSAVVQSRSTPGLGHGVGVEDRGPWDESVGGVK